jgi:hypothetical protein
LPAFYHTSENRRKRHHLNVFLVALNADIKFRRYLKKIRHDPPVTPLPDDVLGLMRLTKDLVDEIYWDAKPRGGTPGEVIIAESLAQKRKNQERAARGDPAKSVESSSEEIEDEDVQMSGPRGMTKADWEPPWPDGADLETRMAYGRALMDGYGWWLTVSVFIKHLRSFNSLLPRPRV